MWYISVSLGDFNASCIKKNHSRQAPVDEISKNNTIWLYHANFMLIIGLQPVLPGNFIDFPDADAYSAFF
jgi:hypothetical protein